MVYYKLLSLREITEILVVIIPYLICYHIKVIRQFECFWKNLLTKETIGCCPMYNH